jgi:hypothetical protein
VDFEGYRAKSFSVTFPPERLGKIFVRVSAGFRLADTVLRLGRKRLAGGAGAHCVGIAERR